MLLFLDLECREVETVYRYVIVLGMINQDNRLRSQMAGHWNHTSSVISKLKVRLYGTDILNPFIKIKGMMTLTN